MSMAGTPKAIARKEHDKAVLTAKAKFREAAKPLEAKYEESLIPLRMELAAELAQADQDYFDALAARRRAGAVEA